MDKLILQPISRISGTVDLPGSKSLSNRILLLSALAEGETRIENLLHSEDTQVMVAALRRLGVHVNGEPGGVDLKPLTERAPRTAPSIGGPLILLHFFSLVIYTFKVRTQAKSVVRLC